MIKFTPDEMLDGARLARMREGLDRLVERWFWHDVEDAEEWLALAASYLFDLAHGDGTPDQYEPATMPCSCNRCHPRKDPE